MALNNLIEFPRNTRRGTNRKPKRYGWSQRNFLLVGEGKQLPPALLNAIQSIQGRCFIFNDPQDLVTYIDIDKKPCDGIFIDCDTSLTKFGEAEQFNTFKDLRYQGLAAPMLFCVATVDRALQLSALNIDLTDFVFKPSTQQELLARMEALIQRQHYQQQNFEGHAEKPSPWLTKGSSVVVKVNEQPAGSVLPSTDTLCFENLRIDITQRRVELAGKAVELTVKEFNILSLLARQPTKVFSRLELLNSIWGCQYTGYDHTISSHINRLRAKLAVTNSKPKAHKYIHTVWGVGYRFIKN